VAGFSAALERGDADALVALLTADVTWSMPPLPHWYAGLDAVAAFAVEVPLTSCGAWRHVPVTANGQPAVASYSRTGDTGPFTPWSINVLTVRDGRIAGITSFLGGAHFAAFGLPDALT
jgi:RNA polymerase sigma-70 factor (ECF subfamily)